MGVREEVIVGELFLLSLPIRYYPGIISKGMLECSRCLTRTGHAFSYGFFSSAPPQIYPGHP